MSRKYFGTDGIRGVVGQSPITPDFMLKLGWAVGRVFASGSDQHSKVIIGKDTRVSGYMFESALEAGLAAAGVDVDLLGPIPTPAVAYLTRTLRANAGIVISASHNPFQDNGIKFFSSEGYKLPDEDEMKIEAELEKTMTVVPSTKIGRATRIESARGRYIEFCKSTVPNFLNLSGMKIVVDCANGATYDVAPFVFRELGAEVIEVAVDPDGLNINLECGATHLKMLQRMVVAEQADLGIALDGDGDRLMMVDHQGKVVDGDEVTYIIASSPANKTRLNGGVVGTLMSNLGLELAIKKLGLEFVRSKVGDRYVMQELMARGWCLGGESSGHIVMLDRTTSGDGIVSALQVLEAMQCAAKSLAEIKSGMTKLPQTLINVPVKDKSIVKNNSTIDQAVHDIEADFAGRGRVLLRPSGTEQLIRVMVEGENDSKVSQAAKSLADVVKAASEV